jgi:Fic family protein
MNRTIEIITDFVANSERTVLSPPLIKELHRLAVDGVDDDRPGQYRNTDDGEISGSKHELPTRKQIEALVDDLCSVANTWTSDPIELAAYVLWRLNWIHPFMDGNGRTARAAAYIVLSTKLGRVLPGSKTIMEQLSWHRLKYYSSLEAADKALASTGKPDVSLMTTLLKDLLEYQLNS